MKSTAGSGPKPDFQKLKAELREHKELVVRVVTGSMEPVIRVGEGLTLEEIKKPLKLFDIVVYWNGTAFICHYVWALNRGSSSQSERWVVTRCIASAFEDFPVLESNILGRVTDRQIPFFRKLAIVIKAKLSR
jgi:signal peptidase I